MDMNTSGTHLKISENMITGMNLVKFQIRSIFYRVENWLDPYLGVPKIVAFGISPHRRAINAAQTSTFGHPWLWLSGQPWSVEVTLDCI